MDSLCVSSNSSACENAPLAHRAVKKVAALVFIKKPPRVCFGAGQRQSDHVQHAQLGCRDDVLGQIFKSHARGPAREFGGKWNAQLMDHPPSIGSAAPVISRL